ncbi:MAG: actin, cytoplasmic 2, partial [Candidatus Hodarchaeota archaeon]
LYAAGRTTGLVVDIGESKIQVVPIYEGFVISHAVKRLDVGGRDITEFLRRLLLQRGYKFTGSIERDWVRDIKESLSYVALDPERELKLAEKVSGLEKFYLLPYGETITLGPERFLAPEVFFNPSSLGLEASPIDEIILDAIRNITIDLRRDLYQNIVLAGGSTLFPGLKERLNKEITELVPENIEIGVIASPDRQYSAWLGGSIVGSLKTFQKMWISKREYLDEGPQIIHRCN